MIWNQTNRLWWEKRQASLSLVPRVLQKPCSKNWFHTFAGELASQLSAETVPVTLSLLAEPWSKTLRQIPSDCSCDALCICRLATRPSDRFYLLRNGLEMLMCDRVCTCNFFFSFCRLLRISACILNTVVTFSKFLPITARTRSVT